MEQHNPINEAEEPFYVLPSEEDDNKVDPTPGDEPPADIASPLHPSATDEEETKHAEPNAFMMLLKLLGKPILGWRAIKNQLTDPEHVARTCFYPLLALTAATSFASLFYDPTLTVSYALVDALVKFLAFFASCFIIGFLWKMVIPQYEEQLTSPFAKILIMMELSTLLIFVIFNNIFPPLEPILTLCPIYAIYLLTRGAKLLLGQNGATVKNLVIMSALLLFTPFGLLYVFSEIMKSSLQ